MTDANAGSIRASIDFDASGLEATINRAMQKATRTIDTSIDRSMTKVEGRISRGFKKTGALVAGFLGLDAIASKLVEAGSYIVKLGADTEKTLNSFQAVSGATAAQMKQVSARAKELGNDISLPGTSAATAAEAMTELAKAGLSVDESMQAAKGTLQLAAAAQISAADAATLQGNALNAFRLSADKAGKVADVLSNSANASAAEITDVGEALSQAGAVAAAAGLSIEETATFLAQFANAGIKGSDAGTLLKTMLLRLQAPAGKAASLMEDLGINIFDANGQMVSAEEITRQLIAATEGMTDAEKSKALATIFGADAVRGANVLLDQGIKVHEKTAKAITKEGAAAELAAAKSKGFTGALGAAQSMLESVAIEIYQNVAPSMDKWLRGALSKAPGLLESAASYTKALLNALKPAAEVVGQFISAAKPGAVVAFKVAMAALLGVLEATAVVLRPLAGFIEDHEQAFRAIVGPLVAATIAFKALKKAADIGRTFRSEQIAAYRGRVEKLRGSFAGATTAASKFRVVGGGLVGAMGGPWGIAIGAAATAIGIFAAKQAEARAKVDQLSQSLNQQNGAITKATRQIVAHELASSGAAEAAKSLGLDLSVVTDAALGNEAAIAQVNRATRDHVSIQHAWGVGSTELGGKIMGLVGAMDEEEQAAWKVRNAISGQNSVIAQARKENNLYRDAVDSVKTSHQQKVAIESRSAKIEAQLSRSVQTTSKSLDGQRKAAKAAELAIEGLNNEALKGINAQVDFEQASDDLRKQIRKLNPEVKKSGKALDIQTQAGRDTYRAMVSLAQASGGVEGGMKRARQQIYNTIRPLVNSKAEARRLTDQFFKLRDSANKVPNNVSTTVKAPGLSKTYADLSRLRGLYNSLDGDVIRTHIVNTQTKVLETIRRRRAKGGAVVGPGTATSDSIPALLSNGEHVLTAAEVQAAGGHEGVFRLRRSLLSGRVAFHKGGGLDRGRPVQRAVRAEPSPLASASDALVENLRVEVGKAEDLPQALDETMFHLRRIKRGGRYAAV